MNGGTVKAQYPVYKAVDSPGWLQYVHTSYPDAIFIYRRWYSQAEQSNRLRNMQTWGVEAAYNQWYTENAATIQAMPWAYFESYNEMDKWADSYLAFEAYRARKLWDVHKVRSCVLNIAAGQSDKDMWARARQMVTAAIDTGSLIGVHAYSEGVITANNGPYWRQDRSWSGGSPFPATLDPAQCHTGFRILQDKRDLAAQGQGQAVLVATEWGLDDMTGGNSANGVYKPFGIPTRGWKSCIPVWQKMGWLAGIDAWTFYRQQQDYWTKMTKNLATVYTCGIGLDHEWDSFDVAGYM